LILLLKSDKNHFPYYAVRALEDLGPVAGEAVPALRKLLNHPDSSLARSAELALRRVPVKVRQKWYLI
jgi:hypothetical protein